MGLKIDFNFEIWEFWYKITIGRRHFFETTSEAKCPDLVLHVLYLVLHVLWLVLYVLRLVLHVLCSAVLYCKPVHPNYDAPNLTTASGASGNGPPYLPTYLPPDRSKKVL